MSDILFITRASRPKDTGSSDIYKDTRLSINGNIAHTPILQSLARGIDKTEIVNFSKDSEHLSGIFPVLTPIYLEEFFRRRGITMKEITSFEDNLDYVKECLKEGVHVIAICTTWMSGINAADEMRQVASHLRQLAPNIPIIAGGMNIRKGLRIRELFKNGTLPGILPKWFSNSVYTKKIANRLIEKGLGKHFLLTDPKADCVFDAFIVCEGGEETLASIVRRVKKGEDIKSLPNLAIPTKDKYIFTPFKPESVDINSEIVDWRRYPSRRVSNEFPIRCSTGCAFKCGFCDFPKLQDISFRSIESLVKELDSIPHNQGRPRRVYFIDDNLGINRNKLVKFAQAIIDKKLNIQWRGFLRADIIDKKTAFLLRESGCYEAVLGIESGDTQILKNMNKRLDPEQALRGIHALDAAGIRTVSTFVVGYPGECANSIKNTAAFISSIPSGQKANAFHRYYLFRFMVSPLSPVASLEQRKKYGLKGIGEKWKHNTMTAHEAKKAIREIFLKVEGPSHVYLAMEPLPTEWSDSSIREIIELRDRIKKDQLHGKNNKKIEHLLKAVKKVESNKHMEGVNISLTCPAEG